MNNIPLAHDLALKRTVHAPLDQKPMYAWRDVLAPGEVSLPPIILLCPHGEERFDMTEVADTLGKAFTNVCISQGEKEIFTEKNRAWVAQICRELGGNLAEMARKQNPLRLTLNELYELIEKTLVDNNAYMVAKSLLLNRSRKISVSRESAAQSTIRVIRRNSQVVPWNDSKVEIAVRKTFLSLARDSAPAVAIAKSVSNRVQASTSRWPRRIYCSGPRELRRGRAERPRQSTWRRSGLPQARKRWWSLSSPAGRLSSGTAPTCARGSSSPGRASIFASRARKSNTNSGGPSTTRSRRGIWIRRSYSTQRP